MNATKQLAYKNICVWDLGYKDLISNFCVWAFETCELLCLAFTMPFCSTKTRLFFLLNSFAEFEKTAKDVTIFIIPSKFYFFPHYWYLLFIPTLISSLHLKLELLYDFMAKTFWAKVQTGQNVNWEKAYLVESQFKIKL